jgi:hypothetical protein
MTFGIADLSGPVVSAGRNALRTPWLAAQDFWEKFDAGEFKPYGE